MMMSNDRKISFSKMHGLGNDFVVIDSRYKSVNLTASLIRKLGDRNFGVGFDQLGIIQNSEGSDAHLTFFNSDGSSSATCGNATRCIANFLMEEIEKDEIDLSTDHISLKAKRETDGSVSVNMGLPEIHWQKIPLLEEVDTLFLPIPGKPTATSMGNPHCSFFVDSLDQVKIEVDGSQIENHPLFPQKTNVQFVSVISEDRLRVRVWERGVGITKASGSSACAAVAASVRRKITGNKVYVDLDGGTLIVNYKDDGIWMNGPTVHVFDGQLNTQFLDSVYEK
ncbi:MAG: diaminopimelate epimerase [Paracoccaceae bacterium]|nr:diaminopimelate epimerase [Paracoccaceae bacterium]